MLSKVEQHVGVSEFRSDVARFLKRAEKKPLVVSTKRGKYPFVVLSAHLYNLLVEVYESSTDAKKLYALKKADRGERIPWSEVRKHA